ncbi:hypothetical protein ABG768_000120, partial [Culter alburnus]
RDRNEWQVDMFIPSMPVDGTRLKPSPYCCPSCSSFSDMVKECQRKVTLPLARH